MCIFDSLDSWAYCLKCSFESMILHRVNSNNSARATLQKKNVGRAENNVWLSRSLVLYQWSIGVVSVNSCNIRLMPFFLSLSLFLLSVHCAHCSWELFFVWKLRMSVNIEMVQSKLYAFRMFLPSFLSSSNVQHFFSSFYHFQLNSLPNHMGGSLSANEPCQTQPSNYFHTKLMSTLNINIT